MDGWTVFWALAGLMLAVDLFVLEPKRHGMKAFWRKK